MKPIAKRLYYQLFYGLTSDFITQCLLSKLNCTQLIVISWATIIICNEQ